jgi:Ca-activated chloride channel family protein
MSHQDVNTLRQIATRLGGTYHDGNTKHLPSALLSSLTVIPRKSRFDQLTKREYALLACAAGGLTLAFLPVLLYAFGTRWRPGVPLASDAKRLDSAGSQAFSRLQTSGQHATVES